MHDLGTLGGSYSYAQGINDAGAVVGGADKSDQFEYAFLYTQAWGMVNLNSLATLPQGATLISANAINASGQIVGMANVAGDQEHAFLLTPWKPGDLNGDGIVNGQDLALIAGNWLATGFNNADANGDGIVKCKTWP